MADDGCDLGEVKWDPDELEAGMSYGVYLFGFRSDTPHISYPSSCENLQVLSFNQ